MNIYTHEEIRTPITKVENAKNNKTKISSKHILKMMKEVEERFVKPQPQPELGGRQGVTLSDISVSLGVKHFDSKRKLDRSSAIKRISALNHSLATYVAHSTNGSQYESYVMDIEAAQHIVSKYDNDAGWAYTDYLIRCKDALTVSLIELEKKTAQIEYLKKKVTESEQREAEPKRIRKKPEHKVVLGEEFSTYDSEGLKKVAKVTAKTLEEMTNTERGLYNIQQNTKKELGLHKKIVRLLIEHKCSDKNILHEADLCLDALEKFNSLVNKTDLERAMEPKKEYLQPQLFATGEKPKYIN